MFFTGDGAFKGTAQRAHVSAAKMGIIGLARGLASEFAPKNIRVNVISPGRIDTSRDPSWYPEREMRDTSGIPVGRLRNGFVRRPGSRQFRTVPRDRR